MVSIGVIPDFSGDKAIFGTRVMTIDFRRNGRIEGAFLLFQICSKYCVYLKMEVSIKSNILPKVLSAISIFEQIS